MSSGPSLRNEMWPGPQLWGAANTEQEMRVFIKSECSGGDQVDTVADSTGHPRRQQRVQAGQLLLRAKASA